MDGGYPNGEERNSEARSGMSFKVVRYTRLRRKRLQEQKAFTRTKNMRERDGT